MKKRYAVLLIAAALAAGIAAQAAVRPNPAVYHQIAYGGRGSTLRITPNGTLIAWGDTEFGAIGEPLRFYIPYGWCRVLKRNIAAVKSSAFATLALDRDGTLWEWGMNGGWSPAHPTTRNGGIQVLDNVVSFAANDSGQRLAVTGDGTLWYWGGAECAPLTPVADNCASALSVCGCFAVVEPEGTLSLLDGQERRPLAEHTAEISPLDNRGDGCRLLVLDSNRQLRILSIQGEADKPVEAELSGVVDTGVAALYDGGYLKDDYTLWGWEDSADAPVQVGRSVVSASFDGSKLTLLYRSGLLVQKDRNSLFARVYPLQTAFSIPASLLILGIWAGAYLVYQKRDIRIKQKDT